MLARHRNLAGGANADANPEVFIFNRGTSAFTQVTNTTTTSLNNPIFSSNPNLSGDGSVISFISNANLTANNDDGGGLSNGEIYIASYNAAAGTVSGTRQVTKTKNGLPVPTPDVSPDPTASANLLTFYNVSTKHFDVAVTRIENGENGDNDQRWPHQPCQSHRRSGRTAKARAKHDGKIHDVRSG